jgi:uncharacterized membrane protein
MTEIIRERFWEVDFLRGAAILMMVTYHTLFLCNYFADCGLTLLTGFWHVFQVATASAFIFLAGVSLTLSFSRAGQTETGKRFFKYLKRGLAIFSLGLVITAGTRIFLGRNFVRFGILHLIGLSVILAYPFLKERRLALPAGILCLAVGAYFKNYPATFQPPGWLFWLVFLKAHYQTTVDYFPVLPWFGVILLGIYLGNLVYRNNKRRFGMPDLADIPFVKQVRFLGRHALVVYFLHAPVLLGILYLSGIIRR